MAASLLASVDDAMPRIEYRHFQLVDQDGGAEPPAGWAQSARMVVAAGRGVLLRTGGNDFYPSVRLEAWSEEPESQSEALWEAVEESDLRCDTGTVLLREWDGGPVGDSVDVGGQGPYRLRAYCRGRAQAEALIGEELYYEGVEEWLIQIWPLKA